MDKPIKRALALKPLSIEHHHALLLCWKIKTGFAKGVAVSRIKIYADWFYNNHLIPHFKLEENFIFPILGSENTLIQQAIAEHHNLIGLFTTSDEIEEALKAIEIALEKHVRFEERILFNEIQKVATIEQLELIEKAHVDEKFIDNSTDLFWI